MERPAVCLFDKIPQVSGVQKSCKISELPNFLGTPRKGMVEI